MDVFQQRKQLKRNLIYQYDSLAEAANHLSVSYHHLVNVLNGRTQMTNELAKKIDLLNSKRLESDQIKRGQI